MRQSKCGIPVLNGYEKEEKMLIRKATEQDIDAIAQIYSDIHTAEENGEVTIGWIRDVYPTRATAEEALERGDLFVGEAGDETVGAAVINQVQVEEYKYGSWRYDVPEDKVAVLHTLVISPKASQKGYGKEFISFYEEYALLHNCPYLRIDTNARNSRARAMYKRLGYNEAGIVPCDFNGIKGVEMVLLEKKVGEEE